MMKTISAFLLSACLFSLTARADDAREAGELLELSGAARCLEPTRSPVRRATVRVVVSSVGTARAVSLDGGTDREERCVRRALVAVFFPASLAGARLEHPIVSVSSLRDRPQKR